MSTQEHAGPSIIQPLLPAVGQVPASRRTDGQVLVLDGVSWDSYRAISEALTGANVRLTYDRGRLELMTRSSAHESWKCFLGRIVEMLSEEAGLPIRGCGEMTCDQAMAQSGLEPDECFYIENEPRVRGKNPIVLGADPPPDLAIEVDITTNSISKLPVYAAIAVPEVWRFDTKTVSFFRLRDGQYEAVPQSVAFPFLQPDDVLSVLRQWGQTDENTLIRGFRKVVRQKIASR